MANLLPYIIAFVCTAVKWGHKPALSLCWVEGQAALDLGVGETPFNPTYTCAGISVVGVAGVRLYGQVSDLPVSDLRVLKELGGLVQAKNFNGRTVVWFKIIEISLRVFVFV